MAYKPKYAQAKSNPGKNVIREPEQPRQKPKKLRKGTLILFVILGVIIIGSDLTSYKKRQKHLEKEILESRKRMEDPQYALRLMQHGYKVPTEYLPNEEL